MAMMMISSVHADEVADFYHGKTVKIYLGFSTGGTYGVAALSLARVLSDHIPGNPGVIVVSMVGAGGMKATNYVYNIANKDGTELLMPPEAILSTELVNGPGIKYTTQNFQWLGTLVQTTMTIGVTSRTGLKTINDAKIKEVVLASTGVSSPTYILPNVVNSLLGTKFKIVTGYSGSAETLRSIELGESDGVALSTDGWKAKEGWFSKQDPFVRVLVQIGKSRQPEFPDTPLLTEIVPPADRRLAEIISSAGPVGRSIAAPPETPPSRVAALRAAFLKATKDPRLVAQLKKSGMDAEPISGEELQTFISELSNTSPETLKRLREMFPSGK
jgi:tripartite-type tricarboxylate transporter receptor subunit TctC